MLVVFFLAFCNVFFSPAYGIICEIIFLVVRKKGRKFYSIKVTHKNACVTTFYANWVAILGVVPQLVGYDARTRTHMCLCVSGPEICSGLYGIYILSHRVSRGGAKK